MPDTLIRAKVAILGKKVEEVSSSSEPFTVEQALRTVGGGLPAAADTRLNGKPVLPSTPVEDGDIIAVVPKIKGG
jgi:sulfur carrier protein ThiS